MADRLNKSFAYRSLLTDTLPYEVPVIFSNDRFHASLASEPVGDLAQALASLVGGVPSYSIPYNYQISKDPRRKTTLSVVHPLAQRAIAEFYELHGSSMLSHCGRGRFALRRPVALASPFAREVIEDEERAKSGIPQLLAQADEADMSHMSSYFAYGKYNLLGKFIASREYIRLESRYPLMRQVDVSKCFYNIYTHSVTWAVKSKGFAKEQRETYSFESRFDKLMQQCNHNETNGIVVGPEFSRIFAEIILQDVDECIESELSKSGLRAGLEYDIRRYVDDYFVFAGDEVVLDRVEECVRFHLQRYKLYVNEKKVETHARPFISALTLARDEIAGRLRDISASLYAMKPELELSELNRHLKQLKAQLSSIRLTVARYDVQFANLSGWLMSRLKKVVRRALKQIGDHQDLRAKEALGDVAVSTLETALYICAIDLRVRTTYSLCQLALILNKAGDALSPEQRDLVEHLLSDHITALVRYRIVAQGEEFGHQDDVELFNLLICGAHFVGADFLASAVVRDALDRMLVVPRVTYFAFISLAFCMRKDPATFQSQMDVLAQRVRERVLSEGVVLRRDTEEYLMAVDYLASPDIALIDKQSFFQKVTSQPDQIGFSLLKELEAHLGFADWTGVTVEHQLRRKELRPVYAWG